MDTLKVNNVEIDLRHYPKYFTLWVSVGVVPGAALSDPTLTGLWNRIYRGCDPASVVAEMLAGVDDWVKRLRGEIR